MQPHNHDAAVVVLLPIQRCGGGSHQPVQPVGGEAPYSGDALQWVASAPAASLQATRGGGPHQRGTFGGLWAVALITLLNFYKCSMGQCSSLSVLTYSQKVLGSITGCPICGDPMASSLTPNCSRMTCMRVHFMWFCKIISTNWLNRSIREGPWSFASSNEPYVLYTRFLLIISPCLL